jgi:hypothetical protein
VSVLSETLVASLASSSEEELADGESAESAVESPS